MQLLVSAQLLWIPADLTLVTKSIGLLPHSMKSRAETIECCVQVQGKRDTTQNALFWNRWMSHVAWVLWTGIWIWNKLLFVYIKKKKTPSPTLETNLASGAYFITPFNQDQVLTWKLSDFSRRGSGQDCSDQTRGTYRLLIASVLSFQGAWISRQ